MKHTKFRNWVRNIWFDYKDECIFYKEKSEELQKYFNKYKYWLKREYKHQKSLP